MMRVCRATAQIRLFVAGVHAVCTDNAHTRILCNCLETSCVKTLMCRTQKDPGHFPSVVEDKYTSEDNQAAARQRDAKSS